MPSLPYPHASSPPASHEDARRSSRSRFTYRQLSQLAGYAPANPLRVVAHIDLDAFYAQCEMIRLGLPEDQPLAVQQWCVQFHPLYSCLDANMSIRRQGLIAVNYPARASGIGRHCNIVEAKKLCPTLITQHVATWREGDDKWAYRTDAERNIATDKVSLDPYRMQSRKILALIRDSLPAKLQKVEKASVDEVFLDLSAHVHSILMERFPELSAPPPYDDPTENLPLPSLVALDWKADALVDLSEDQEALDPDWDDVAMLVGSEIVRDVRAAVREKLQFTCSAGIASNKLLSKLGSAYKKPNAQTVVRNRAVGFFLHEFKFTKIRNLGGKLGDHVAEVFDTESLKELLPVTLDQLKAKLGDETGIWLHNTIRGIDYSEVNPRTQIKSMLSAKSFRPTVTSTEQAKRWLRIFAGDIFSRLVEEGVLENVRRPRTIHLSARWGGSARSKQIPIAQGRPIDEAMLVSLANDVLAQILAEGAIWPCHNLSLSVGGFQEGIKNNMGIDNFLVTGDDAVSLRAQQQDGSRPPSPERPAKRTKTGGPSIQSFFSKAATPDAAQSANSPYSHDPTDAIESHGMDNTLPSHQEASLMTCARCGESFSDDQDLQSHQDWHMAKDLQDQEERSHLVPLSVASRPAPGRPAPSGGKKSSRGGAGAAGKSTGRLEQGQRKLHFG